MSPLVPRTSPDEACLSFTQGLCNTCGALVDAKVVDRDGRIVLVKWCKDHGLTEGLVSSDRAWYTRSAGYLKPGTEPLRRAVDRHVACPQQCGLCPQHQQHTCVPLLEITSDCDMACPICLVTDRVKPALSVDEAAGIVDALVAAEGKVNMLTLTGGEPTQHPQFLDIVKRCLRPEIAIVSVSTNGLWIEKDDGLIHTLRDLGVVISLQVDGFSAKVNQALRGQADLGERKRRIVDKALRAGARLSLTFTLAKDTNEADLPEVLGLLLDEENVLSLMVQPLAHMGTRPKSDLHRVTVPDAVKLLAGASRGVLKESDFTPLPCSHPTCFALTYLLRLKDGGFVTMPSILDAETYLDLIKNQALMATDPDSLAKMRDALYTLWSSDGILPQRENLLKTLRQLLLDMGSKHKEVLELGTRHIKSVFIHHFMDRSNFDLSRVVKCCNHYPRIDGRLQPACVRNNIGWSE